MTQRIITRGLGTRQLLCTRGYGRLGARIAEVIRMCSCFVRQIVVKSPWRA